MYSKMLKVPSDVSLTPPKTGSSVCFLAWQRLGKNLIRPQRSHQIKFDQIIQLVPVVTGLQPLSLGVEYWILFQGISFQGRNFQGLSVAVVILPQTFHANDGWRISEALGHVRDGTTDSPKLGVLFPARWCKLRKKDGLALGWYDWGKLARKSAFLLLINLKKVGYISPEKMGAWYSIQQIMKDLGWVCKTSTYPLKWLRFSLRRGGAGRPRKSGSFAHGMCDDDCWCRHVSAQTNIITTIRYNMLPCLYILTQTIVNAIHQLVNWQGRVGLPDYYGCIDTFNTWSDDILLGINHVTTFPKFL